LYLHMGHLAAGQNVVGERLDPDGWLSRIRRGTQTNKNENRVALFGGWSMRADRHELTRQSAFPTQKRPFHCSLLTGAFLWVAPVWFLASMAAFGANSVTLSGAAFVGLCCLVYFALLSVKGPYPRVARQAESDTAKIMLKKSKHLALL